MEVFLHRIQGISSMQASNVCFSSVYEWLCKMGSHDHTFKERLKLLPPSCVFQVWFSSTNTISSLIFVLSPHIQDYFHLILT